MLSDGEMVTADAARALGVSVRQVRRLAESGQLAVVGRVGSGLVLTTASVHRLASRARRRGRPWLPATAWAAVDLLESGTTTRLTELQQRRLRANLHGMRAQTLIAAAVRRADAHRFRALGSFLPHVAERLALTGAAAITQDRELAARFGLASGGETSVDGYLTEASASEVIASAYLTPDDGGNVTLRVTDQAPACDTRASVALVALDLAESVDVRERSAGLDYLTSLLATL